MKTQSTSQGRHEHAFTLLEMVVYMVVFLVVVACATKTFYESWENSKALRRGADDIARALDIGKRWRADVRGATGVVNLTGANGVEQLRIPSVAGEVIYTFANGDLRRQAGSRDPEALWLSGVKTSHMQSDARGSVTAWRWELELKSVRKQGRVRPLFTFETAAGTAAIQ